MIDFTAYGIDEHIIFNEIQCPECKEWVDKENWTETEVYCEYCGTHDAMKCPKCDESFDHVWHPDFEVR